MSHHCWSKYFAKSDACLANVLEARRIRGEAEEREVLYQRLLIEKKPGGLIAIVVVVRVALGFMAIRDLLLPMRDGFSGEGNTNGATLSSGGHIGIGGKHMAGGPINSCNRFPCNQSLRAFQCSIISFTSSAMFCALTREMLPNNWQKVQKVVGSQFDGDHKLHKVCTMHCV